MIYVGTGGIKVELDTHAAERVRRLVDQFAPGIRAALEREAKAVYDDAREAWPVRTGVSRDGLRWGVVVAPDLSSITGRVWDSVSYAMYIKSPKIRTGTGSAFVELLRKPIAVRTKTLVVELRNAVGKVTSG